MKYAFATAALVAAVVSAQTLADIPACALPCLSDAVTKNTNCQVTDYKCICEHGDALQSAAGSCVMDKCGAQEAVSTVLPALKGMCAKVMAAAPAPAPSAQAAPSSPAAPAPPASSETCTDEAKSTPPPPPPAMSTSTYEAMSASSSECEPEKPESTPMTYAASSAPVTAPYPVSSAAAYPTTTMVKVGTNGTSPSTNSPPIATAGAATVGGSVAALAAFAVAALAL
ncbi:extracellular membrane CFEM domain-containing protein [Apiospora arundinis]|uniref:Extracellular membrane CFEM domain-containing protein n=1 Tax=Apiospora arundinis TaxID=335852 RepID=A0ABR2I9I4_9PEZI